MRYFFEDLAEAQFEDLTVEIMRTLFGLGVSAFASGPDGGRDAKFHGTAARFPSTSDPWVGITIGQAKHTNALNAHFSDPDFSGATESSVISKEIPRVRSLVRARKLDNYILFSNRRLGANADDAIIDRIAADCGLQTKNIALAGVEYLESILRSFPEISVRTKVNPFDGPLLASSQELAEVILALSSALHSEVPDEPPMPVDRVSFSSKNLTNGMTEEFARLLTRNYLGYSHTIQQFLSEPANADILEQYQGITEEFELKVVAKRRNFQAFDDVFNHLTDTLFARDPVLARHKRLTRALVFHMYFACDIGSEDVATTN